MKLIVDGAAGLVTVDEPENLKSLSVQLRACSPGHASVLLAGRDLGLIDDGHAWLHIDALRAIARQPRSCTWDERFQRAMAYAQRNGWTDPTGDFVRAHLEPSPPAAETPTAGPGTADAPATDTPTAGIRTVDAPTADSPAPDSPVAAGPPANSQPSSNQES